MKTINFILSWKAEVRTSYLEQNFTLILEGFRRDPQKYGYSDKNKYQLHIKLRVWDIKKIIKELMKQLFELKKDVNELIESTAKAVEE